MESYEVEDHVRLHIASDCSLRLQVLAEDLQEEGPEGSSFQVGGGPDFVVENEGVNKQVANVGNVDFLEFVAAVGEAPVEFAVHVIRIMIVLVERRFKVGCHDDAYKWRLVTITSHFKITGSKRPKLPGEMWSMR